MWQIQDLYLLLKMKMHLIMVIKDIKIDSIKRHLKKVNSTLWGLFVVV